MTAGTDSDRLDNVEAQLRTLTAAVDALVTRQQPGWFSRVFSHPPVWLATIGFLIAVAAFTIRNVDQVQSNSARIRVLEDVVPVVGVNIERMAASLDNLCANLAVSQRARAIAPLPCARTLIDPFVVPRR